jgi:hypothetical protein
VIYYTAHHEDEKSLAYDEGYRAFEESKTIINCPYEDTGESGSLYTYWTDGFIASCKG